MTITRIYGVLIAISIAVLLVYHFGNQKPTPAPVEQVKEQPINHEVESLSKEQEVECRARIDYNKQMEVLGSVRRMPVAAFCDLI